MLSPGQGHLLPDPAPREHGYGILSTKAAKERKGLEIYFVIFASAFFLAGFALKMDRVSAECFFIGVHSRSLAVQ